MTTTSATATAQYVTPNMERAATIRTAGEIGRKAGLSGTPDAATAHIRKLSRLADTETGLAAITALQNAYALAACGH